MTNVAHADFDVPATDRAPRTNLYLAATLIGARSRMPVTVRNLSETGALVRAREPLVADEQLQLVRGSLEADCSFAWSDGLNGGLRFAKPLDLAAWLPGGPPSGQREVDRLLAEGRARRAPPGASAAVASAGSPVGLNRRIAEEIAFVSRKLEALGTSLADDVAVVMRHGREVQELDIGLQILGHLIRLLAADDPQSLLADIGMEDLRRRLQRTTIG